VESLLGYARTITMISMAQIVSPFITNLKSFNTKHPQTQPMSFSRSPGVTTVKRQTAAGVNGLVGTEWKLQSILTGARSNDPRLDVNDNGHFRNLKLEVPSM